MATINIADKNTWFKLITWAFVFGFFFSIINIFQDYKYALGASAFNVITLYFTHYISTRYLIPIFNKKNTRKYLWTALIVLFIIAGITSSIEIFIIDRFRVQTHEAPPLFFHYLRQILMLSFVLFVDNTFNLIEQTTKLKESEKLLTEEKLETELKLLKAQIDPHFIFNALNNIYSLTYMQSANAPDSVLKLSEMLRYVFYDCSNDKVNIASEIKYIENFSAFQQMKSETIQNISLNTHVQNSMTEIAPMLMIPFIENAFKYSRIEEDPDAFVKTLVTQDTDRLLFSIKNSIPKENKPLSGSGMGIKNVQHRLEIIYPQSHELQIIENKTDFEVKLELKV